MFVRVSPKLGYRKAWIRIRMDPDSIDTLDADPH
jgi:hypothetical protein